MTRATPTVRTGLLAAGLALAGAGLAATVGSGAELTAGTAYPHSVVVVAFVGVFCAAELLLLHTEFRRQAYSFTLAGVPLVLGLFLLPGRDIVLARVAGAALAFLIQRPSLIKGLYNTSAYAFEPALDLVLVEHLLGHQPHLGLVEALICILVVAAVDQVMSVLVLVVISFHQDGRMSWAEARDVLLPALIFSLSSSTVAVAVLVLLGSGLLGDVVLCALVGAALAAHRGYQVLYRRHEALRLMHEFVSDNVAVTDFDELATRLLARSRILLKAARAELLIVRDGSVLQLAIGENDETGGMCTGDLDVVDDWLLRRVQQTRKPALLPRQSKDLDNRRWLDERGFRDAIVVAVPEADEISGDSASTMLIMADRLGDTTSFTREDSKLAETVAAHLAVVLRNTQLIERLRYEAAHDTLTGLSNRSDFNAKLSAVLAGPDAARSAVLLLDVDRFKEVNDTLGHHVGDQLLVVLSGRLRKSLPAEAVVARLGGDEFALLLPDQSGETETVATARHIAAELAQSVQVSEATLSCHVSIGVCPGTPGLAAADALRHADTAMYAAKDGGTAVVVYTPELDRGRMERLALLADLHLALERDELDVHYQPKLDMVTGKIIGAEALVRWTHPHLGPLTPDTFIPLAESTGLIDELTQQVLHKALRECRQWQTTMPGATVAVNLSGRCISDGALPERISAALAEAALPASLLVLEITESSALAEEAVTIPTLERLAELGVTLSLDDFGTGYSSLAYLHKLPVGEIKIDRSFVRGLGERENAAASEALITSTIHIAATLGLRTVAEGIEHEDALQRLREMGCDVAQGYLVGKPCPAADFLRVPDRAESNIPEQRKRLTLLTG